jgi:hypothetical protein
MPGEHFPGRCSLQRGESQNITPVARHEEPHRAVTQQAVVVEKDHMAGSGGIHRRPIWPRTWSGSSGRLPTAGRESKVAGRYFHIFRIFWRIADNLDLVFTDKNRNPGRNFVGTHEKECTNESRMS